MYQTTIKHVYKYSETRLMMQSLPPLELVRIWRYARGDIHTNISHYKYNMYQTTIKLVYKYPEARLML